MQILVKTLRGTTLLLDDVKRNESIDTLKQLIYMKEGILPKEQELMLMERGKSWERLESGKTVSDYNIENETILYLVLRI
jgi:hypothetical protein